MIAKERLINKLEHLGMNCVTRGQRIALFKGRIEGLPRVATINIEHDLIDELTARQTLRLVGCDLEEIDAFISQNRAVLC